MLENGFVLLTSSSFNNNQFVQDLQSEWQITATGAEVRDGSLVFSVGDYMCALGLMPTPIPNQEAVYRAKGNYYCPDAVAIAEAHQAHLMVTVMNQSGSEIEGMRLYSKLVATCLKQANATGVYTSETVFSADFYRKVALQYLPNSDLPIMIWVFVGMGQTEQGNQLYTSGLNKFGKDEMEILNSKVDMRTLHTSLTAMCSHIVSADVVLKDGETVGFSAEQKWQISRSKSVYAPSEFSLKITVV